MNDWFTTARLIHVLAAVFMAAPLYMLIVVNERARYGRAIEQHMDGYMEGIITGQGLGPLVSNWMVAAKLIPTLVLLGILTYVHTTIQPQIMALLAALFAWRVFNVPVPFGFA